VAEGQPLDRRSVVVSTPEHYELRPPDQNPDSNSIKLREPVLLYSPPPTSIGSRLHDRRAT
jgi:hypothetical protein